MILLAKEDQSGMSGIYKLQQNERRKRKRKEEREINKKLYFYFYWLLFCILPLVTFKNFIRSSLSVSVAFYFSLYVHRIDVG